MLPMFFNKNNTSNATQWKTALKNLGKACSRNKPFQNRSVFVAVMLATVIFTMIPSLMQGVLVSLRSYLCTQTGTTAHVCIYGLNNEEYRKVKNIAGVKDSSYLIVHGFLGTVPVAYCENKMFQWEDREFTGQLPEDKDSIVLGTDTLRKLNIRAKTGEEVTITWKRGEESYTGTFRLSGYYTSNPSTVSVPGAYSEDTVPETDDYIYLSRDYFNEIIKDGNGGKDLRQMNIFFSNGLRLGSKMDSLQETYGRPLNFQINGAYTQTDIFDGSSSLFIIAAILMAGTFFAGYFVIYSIFQLSIAEDIRFYGLLKTLGCYGGKFQYFLRRQVLSPCLWGIAAGGLAGVFIGIKTVPFILDCFTYNITDGVSFYPLTSLAGILFAWFTVYTSYTQAAQKVSSMPLVESIKYEENDAPDIKDKKPDTRKYRNYRFAWKMVRINLKKNLVLTGTLFIIMLLFLCTCTFMKSVNPGYYLNGMFGNFQLGVFMENNLSAAEITDISYLLDKMEKELSGISNTSKSRIAMAEIGLERGSNEEFDSSKAFGYLDKNNLTYNPYTKTLSDNIQLSLFGMDLPVARKLNVTDGVFDAEKYKTGRYILTTTELTDGMGSSTGEYYPNPGMAVYNIGDKVQIKNRQYEVMAIVEVPTLLHAMITCNEIPFIMPSEEVYKLYPDSVMVYGEIYSGTDSEIEELEKEIAGFTRKNRGIEISSIHSVRGEVASFSKVVLLVCGILSVFTGIVLFMHFVNTIVSGIMHRNRLFNMLLNIGMKKNQLKDVLKWEIFIETGIAILFSCILGSLFSVFVLKPLCEETAIFVYSYSIIPVLILGSAITVIMAKVSDITLKKAVRRGEGNETYI